jgi:hypothetical protein
MKSPDGVNNQVKKECTGQGAGAFAANEIE